MAHHNMNFIDWPREMKQSTLFADALVNIQPEPQIGSIYNTTMDSKTTSKRKRHANYNILLKNPNRSADTKWGKHTCFAQEKCK